MVFVKILLRRGVFERHAENDDLIAVLRGENNKNRYCENSMLKNLSLLT